MAKKLTKKVSLLLDEESYEKLKSVQKWTKSSRSKALRDALTTYHWVVGACVEELEGSWALNELVPEDVSVTIRDVDLE